MLDPVAEIETLRREAEEREAALAASQTRLAELSGALNATREALKASRAERDALQREIDNMRARQNGAGEAADAALREAIVRLGAEVARLWAKGSAVSHPE